MAGSVPEQTGGVSRPTYVLAQLSFRDRDRYARYAARFSAVLARHGGQLLVADEAPRVLEGEWQRDKVVLLRFEGEQAFQAWAGSPEYRAILEDRVAGADATVLLLRGVA